MRVIPQFLNSPVVIRPDRFQIQLERHIFFPGQTVKGNLVLHCSTPIKCRGVRMHLQGQGTCNFTTGSGDNKQHHSHTQYYSNCKRTVFGTVHKTAVIRNAGANAIFGPPWSPDEGEILIGVSPDTEYLVFRVMDYDWCKKDDLLGEVLVDIRQHLNHPKVELQLYRKGKPEKSHIEFNVSYAENYHQLDVNGQPLKGISIRLFKTINLRSGDWFGGKNDVYVQVYGIPPGPPPPTNRALPEPHFEMMLPAGQFNVPFSFQLPQDLPSSMVSLSGDDYIVHSVYAYIDVAWRADPSTRCFFTVMQHQNPALYVTPADKTDSSFSIDTQCVIPPFCCFSVSCGCCGSHGRLSCRMTTPRSSYAPGETVDVHVEFNSNWPDFSTQWRSVTINLNQIVSCWAGGHTFTYERSLTMPNIQYNQGNVPAGQSVAKDMPFTIPICPPSYAGGLGREGNWLGEVSRYGGFWAMKSFDPITWNYSLLLELRMGLPGCTCGDQRVFYRLPISITAVNPSAYDSLSRGVDLFNIVRRPAPPTQQYGQQYGQQPGQQYGQNHMAVGTVVNVSQPYQQQMMHPVQMQVMQRNMPGQPIMQQQMMQPPMMMQQMMHLQQPMMMQAPMTPYGAQQQPAGFFPQTPQQFQQPQLPMASTIPNALPYSTPVAQGANLSSAPLVLHGRPITPDHSVSTATPYQTPVASRIPEPQPNQPSQGVNYGVGIAADNYNTSDNHANNNANTTQLPTQPPVQHTNNATTFSAVLNAPHVNDPHQPQEYRADNYRHSAEANPFFAGNIELVESTTRRVIRDPEEDCTVQSDMELMYCPMYFKCS